MGAGPFPLLRDQASGSVQVAPNFGAGTQQQVAGDSEGSRGPGDLR